MSNSLQHTRLPCPSLSPRVCSDSCPLSRWCHSTISFTVIPYFSLPSIFSSVRVFSNESVLRISWPKYWNFSFNISISPFSEYSGLISFRIDWFDFLAVQGTRVLRLFRTQIKMCYDKSKPVKPIYHPPFFFTHLFRKQN